MSILIKGEKMPESCYKCDFVRDIDWEEEFYEKCILLDKPILHSGRHNDCPLVEIPTPHDKPRGEWIRDRYWSRGVGMGEEYGFFYKCSLCEYEVEDGYTRCGFNFCPNCGAKMKGADDETN